MAFAFELTDQPPGAAAQPRNEQKKMRSPTEIVSDVLDERGTDIEAEDILGALEAEGWAVVLDRDAVSKNEDE
jgi:hypothetical protein